MTLTSSAEFGDTNDELYAQATVNVGTTEVEAKVGATRNPQRQVLRIYNNGNQTVYVGPTGVTASSGEPLRRRQSMTLQIQDLGVFMITQSSSSDVIVTELG